jgi:hypothetical protein
MIWMQKIMKNGEIIEAGQDLIRYRAALISNL